jgi:membrane-associated phospholipid phosphatase
MILNVLYVLVPATVLRPTIESNDIFSTLLRDMVWQLDEPVNTFPSNHVTLSVIAILTLASLKLGHWWVLPLQLWLGLVCISTLLVYQHVVLDLIAGVAIGIAVYLGISKVLMRRAKS